VRHPGEEARRDDGNNARSDACEASLLAWQENKNESGKVQTIWDTTPPRLCAMCRALSPRHRHAVGLNDNYVKPA
ncbi:MAG: hypothetical protein PHD37_03915, partial [Gallionellaceae bacterium]|nr:hypothetical protein [Gallionellaceae bacterium]